MRVFRYVHNQKTYVSIVNENMCPICYYVTNYLSLVIGDIAPNSKEAKARDLMFFLKWLSACKIDIVNRIENGKFLSANEAYSFIVAAKYRVGAVKPGCGRPIKFMTDKFLSNRLNLVRSIDIRISQNVTNSRLREAKSYLTYLSNEIHRMARDITYIQKECARTVSNLQEGIRKTRSNHLSCDHESRVPDKVFLEVLEVIDPSSIRNPFVRCKYRNSLIFKILIETGIRRGALAKLKISDFDFTKNGRFLNITRVFDDAEDTRVYKPAQKTLSHTSLLSYDLMQAVDEYIEFIRSRFSASNNHEFLFVSEISSKGVAGQPLSMSSINKIFGKVSEVVGFNVTPHSLRHKWNEVFTETAERMGIKGDEQNDLRKYAMGWSRSSEMVHIYNRMKLGERVREIHMERQKMLASAVQKNED